MKIMQLISSNGFYGAERVVVELSAQLRSKGYRVMLATIAGSDGNDRGVCAGAQARRIPVERIACRNGFDLSALKRLKEQVVENDFTIVHSHGYKANFYARFSGIASCGTRLVTTCHNWLGESLKMRTYRWIDKRVIRGFDRVAVVSEALREEAARAGVPAGKIALIRNGIDVDARREERNYGQKYLKAKLGIRSRDRVIMLVGRLSPEKGYRYLIRAIKLVAPSYPTVRAFVAGDGPQKEALVAEVHREHLGGHIRFLGRQDNVKALLSLGEIFVMPSLKEGMPVALLEAMRAKKPVIVTRVGEIPNIIDAGCGILVGPGDVRGLAGALMELLADRRKAISLGEKGLEKVKREFSAERMAQSYLRMYREISPDQGK